MAALISSGHEKNLPMPTLPIGIFGKSSWVSSECLTFDIKKVRWWFSPAYISSDLIEKFDEVLLGPSLMIMHYK